MDYSQVDFAAADAQQYARWKREAEERREALNEPEGAPEALPEV